MPRTAQRPPAIAGAPLPPPPPPPGEVTVQWSAEFSRFFNTPRSPTSSNTALRRLPKGKIRVGGTWLTAANPAVVALRRLPGAGAAVLAVSVRGVVYEEHFVSNLYFSWPQVSCVAECPVRGSRVVFMSYKDGSAQVEKFAVRFSTSATAEAFMNSVKECPRDTMDLVDTCETSSVLELVASNAMDNRCQEEGYEERITTSIPEISVVTSNEEDPRTPLQFLSASNNQAILSSLPPDFLDLLTNDTPDSRQEQQTIITKKTNFQSQDGGCPPNLSSHGTDVTPQPVVDIDQLKAQIANHMSDASFEDMLSKLEGAIHELGGDMALEARAPSEATVETRTDPEAKFGSTFSTWP